MNNNYKKTIIRVAAAVMTVLMMSMSGCSDKTPDEEQKQIVYQTSYSDIIKASENMNCDVYIPEKAPDGYMITSMSIFKETDLSITYESDSFKITYTVSSEPHDNSNDESFPAIEKKNFNGIKTTLKMVMDYPEPIYIVEYKMGSSYISIDCLNEADAEKFVTSSVKISDTTDINSVMGIAEKEYPSADEMAQDLGFSIPLPESFPENYKPSRFYSISGLIGAVDLSDGDKTITFAVSRNATARNFFNEYSANPDSLNQSVKGLIVPVEYSIIPNEKNEPVIYLASWGDTAEKPIYNYIIKVPFGLDDNSFSKLASDFYSASISPIYEELGKIAMEEDSKAAESTAESLPESAAESSAAE